jgi:hypothetical protein
MLRRTNVLMISILVVGWLTPVHSQDNSTVSSRLAELKTIVVTPDTKSNSVIAVPPATSVTMSLRDETHAAPTDVVDLTASLSRESAQNGLQSTDLQPWHIVVSYDQFDEDGDNIHSGVYEEFWAGPKKYRRIYKSDNLNQTDYATDRGLFRRGDQQWPDRAELQVRSEVVDPFYYAATLEGFRARRVERTFGGHVLQCLFMENLRAVSDPAQYCFEPDDSVLRYSRGLGWYQTVYNQIVSFQGRNVARNVEVTDGGKPYLKLSVETIELISRVDEADFAPPVDAAGPLGDRVSGVLPVRIKNSFPQWPESLRGQRLSVEVAIVIGKDGHVVSAHAVGGPPEAQKACEDAARKTVFQPYLVLDKPVEVETRITFMYQ